MAQAPYVGVSIPRTGVHPLAEHYILVTGWMGSGKSTLLREYDCPKIDFLTPQGLRSDYFDVSFGVDRDGTRFYFYELDSPTVLGAAWIVYVRIAEGVIIIYDCLYGERYGTLAELSTFLLSHTTPKIPFLFVANKTENEAQGLEELKRLCHPEDITDRSVGLRAIHKAHLEEDEHGQPQVKLESQQIDAVFEWMLQTLKER